MLFSEEAELKLGKNNFGSAIWGAEGGGGEYQDERLRRYLEGIVLKLHQASHRPHIPCKFVIQNTSIPNAWALPGYVVITRGLLAELNSEAEFAYIMGHEIGHIAARHSASSVSKAILVQGGLVLLGLALQGKEYSDLVLGLGVVTSKLVLLKYSRDDELEADRLGVLYMSKVGYNPQYAIEAFGTLERAVNEYKASVGISNEERSFLDDLLSTHPRTEVRIEEIKKIINQTPKYPIVGDGVNRKYFQYMISDLKRINKVYKNYFDKAVREYKKGNNFIAELLVKEAIKREPDQAPFYALLGMINYRRGEYSEAQKNFEYALSLQNNYQPAIRGLGMLSYKRKNYQEAISILKQAHKLFPDDPLSNYYIGVSYYELDQCDKAIKYLEKYVEMIPNHVGVNTYMGICYEEVGDIKSAYEAYLRQIKIAPNNEEGKHAAKRIPILKNKLEAERERQLKEESKQKKVR